MAHPGYLLRWAPRLEHRRRRGRSLVDFAVSARRDRHARRKLSGSRVVVPCGPNYREVDMRARSEEKRSEEKKGKLEKPANYYKSPDDIVKDKDLSPAEKRQALNTWEQGARQMLTASNEGMEGDQEGLDRRDSHRQPVVPWKSSAPWRSATLPFRMIAGSNSALASMSVTSLSTRAIFTAMGSTLQLGWSHWPVLAQSAFLKTPISRLKANLRSTSAIWVSNNLKTFRSWFGSTACASMTLRRA